jgi:hypothetical protein
MLNERPAHAFAYDAASDVARLAIGAAGGTRKTTTFAQLLLDRQGFLVGVDLVGTGATRMVVMLGPHEKVDRTHSARVVVSYDATGQPAEIEVGDARNAIRAAEKNPYA